METCATHVSIHPSTCLSTQAELSTFGLDLFDQVESLFTDTFMVVRGAEEPGFLRREVINRPTAPITAQLQSIMGPIIDDALYQASNMVTGTTALAAIEGVPSHTNVGGGETEPSVDVDDIISLSSRSGSSSAMREGNGSSEGRNGSGDSGAEMGDGSSGDVLDRFGIFNLVGVSLAILNLDYCSYINALQCAGEPKSNETSPHPPEHEAPTEEEGDTCAAVQRLMAFHVRYYYFTILSIFLKKRVSGPTTPIPARATVEANRLCPLPPPTQQRCR